MYIYVFIYVYIYVYICIYVYIYIYISLLFQIVFQISLVSFYLFFPDISIMREYLKTQKWDAVNGPVDMGFVVQRVYEGVDDKDDVTLDENGVGHIKAGARVRVRVTMVADNRRYHVALVDPLPAGLEIINPALAVA